MTMKKKCVAMSLTHRNKDKIVKGSNSIYHDLDMDRYTKVQNFKAAVKSKALQRILIEEMISSLRSFLILDKTKMIPYQTTIMSFLTYDNQRIDMENKFKK